VTDEALAGAVATKSRWRAELASVLARVDVIALPTLVMFPPLIGDSGDSTVVANVAVNLAGHPSLVLSVPTGGPLPTSIQLVGPDLAEDRLLAVGRVLEGAAASL
jgi:Asp-tRNA(Asn)/Glu-tRNA(Gln) amidotransferase A subunit family amidase